MKKLAVLVSLFYFLAANAQFKHPYFNRLTVETGLPEGYVESSLQDKLGYIWLGTQNGLVRYDGYGLKKYPVPGDDGKPLVVTTVVSLFEDADGIIWIGTYYDGFYYYDRQADKLVKPKNYYYKNDTLRTDQVIDIKQDNNKNIWLLGRDREKNIYHVDKFNRKENSVEVYSKIGDKAHFLKIRRTYSLFKDNLGQIWVSGDSLLNLYNPAADSFKPYLLMPDKDSGEVCFNDLYADPFDANLIWATTIKYKNGGPLPYYNVININTKNGQYKVYNYSNTDSFSLKAGCTSIYTDAQKRMWFINGNTISLYNRQHNNFTNYRFDFPSKRTAIVHFQAAAVNEDGELWAGGDFAGLFLLNLHTGKYIYYEPGLAGTPGAIPNAGVNSIFFDKKGVLWVSFPFSGIGRLDKQRSFFSMLRLDMPFKTLAEKNDEKNTIRNILKNDDSTFFVLAGNTVYNWKYLQDTLIATGVNLPNTSTNSIYKDKEGIWWISNDFSGLYSFNPYTHTLKNYQFNAKDSSSISGNDVMEVIEDKQGLLWVATFDGGICSFDKHTGKFTRYPYTNSVKKANGNALYNSQVETFMFDTDGILWVGTNLGGIASFNPKTGIFKNTYSKKDGLECVTSIYEDKKGRLWAGTYRTGFFLIDRKTGRYKRYGEDDGMAYNGVNSICEDENGNIWTTSLRGLSKLNPQTGEIKTFTTANGLPENKTATIFPMANREFAIKCYGGLINFNPTKFQKNNNAPFVAIESIGYHFAADKRTNSDTTLFVYGRTEIALRYNENKITFNYVALHYTDPALNQYAYKLDGYDKAWVKAGTQRSVTYLNLAPGSYTFHVKAANSDGVWNETGASIAIIIYPPWWQTWWAYTFYAIALAAAIWGFVYYRGKKLQRDNKVLEHKIKLRTNEVLEQKEEIIAQRDNLEKTLENLQATQEQLLQKEKMASLGELTAGIAHEIQNPLNFVNNFSEVSQELIGELNEEMEKGNYEDVRIITHDLANNLQKINHHGRRADSIVKNMLQHSRKSTGQKEPTDINALAEEYMRLSYHGLRAKDKNFNAKLETVFDSTLPKVNIIGQDVGRVLLNIYNNAFYATMQKKTVLGDAYQPAITVTTKKAGNAVEISIRDNGTGIPKAILDKIYHPFFTTKPTGEGTGLGLSLSYDIICKVHAGALRVETAEGEYAEFIITLPL